MTEQFSLTGKKALITGGTRGIGKAIALRLARSGASVIANHVRDIKSAAAFKTDAGNEDLDIHICRADLTSQKGIDKLFECVSERFGKMSILVHCAATGIHRPLADLSLREFDFVYALNVRAFFNLAIRLIPTFEKSGGSILAISSEGAVHALPQYSLVGSSKGALESLVRYMANEFAQLNIRANTLSAGTVMTDAWKVLPNNEQRLADALNRSPRKQLTTADEVASVAQFLCSDASVAIVGQTIVVDGGTSIVS